MHLCWMKTGSLFLISCSGVFHLKRMEYVSIWHGWMWFNKNIPEYHNVHTQLLQCTCKYIHTLHKSHPTPYKEQMGRNGRYSSTLEVEDFKHDRRRKEWVFQTAVDRHNPLNSSYPLCCPCHKICRSVSTSHWGQRPEAVTCWFTKVWSTRTNYRRKRVLTTSIWWAMRAIICDMWNQCESIILSLHDKTLLAGACSSLNWEEL